jgi:hypothetical protein
VNGGLAFRKSRWVKPWACAGSETTNRESTSPVRRERIGTRPRVARDRHPAVSTSPKAVRRSRDQGCNDHWILRRALTDGRHPGSLRGVHFHERAFRVVLAGPCILRPVRNLPKGGRTANPQPARRCVRREGEQGSATGVSEVRSSPVSWDQKRPRSQLEAIASSVGKRTDGGPPKRSSDVVKRPVPRHYRTEPKTPWGVPAAKVA